MTAWSDASSHVASGTARYGDGVAWSYVAAGVSEDDAAPRINATTLVDDVFTAFGDDLRSAALSEDVPVELLTAAVCSVVSEAGNVVAATSYERFLSGFLGEEETPTLAYSGCAGVRLDKAHAVGITRAGLLVPSTAIPAAARVMVGALSQTRFQVPIIASVYYADGLRYDETSRWRMAGQEQIDRFIAWFNTAVRAIQMDGTIAGSAPNFTEVLARIPAPGQPTTPLPVANSWGLRRPESIAFVAEGMMTVCMSNPGLSALWSVDPTTLDQIKGVAQDAKAGMGLPKGASVFAYPDFGGTMRIMTEKEVIALYIAMRDFVNDVMYFDTGRAPALPGQPVLLSP